MADNHSRLGLCLWAPSSHTHTHTFITYSSHFISLCEKHRAIEHWNESYKTVHAYATWSHSILFHSDPLTLDGFAAALNYWSHDFAGSVAYFMDIGVKSHRQALGCRINIYAVMYFVFLRDHDAVCKNERYMVNDNAGWQLLWKWWALYNQTRISPKSKTIHLWFSLSLSPFILKYTLQEGQTNCFTNTLCLWWCCFRGGWCSFHSAKSLESAQHKILCTILCATLSALRSDKLCKSTSTGYPQMSQTNKKTKKAASLGHNCCANGILKITTTASAALCKSSRALWINKQTAQHYFSFFSPFNLLPKKQKTSENNSIFQDDFFYLCDTKLQFSKIHTRESVCTV